MDSSPPSGRIRALEPSLPSTAGVKRPAPTLLPPFEPLSSSPGLPRPLKRQAASNAHSKYPTPVPTSSTGILSSSPPRLGSRPALQRTQSSVSERAPLSAVPSIELNENGETLLMGRSSNSSHYQLSANRLISRVHVKARFVPAPQPADPNKVEVICNGWNGLKLHCQGRTWELSKGDTFTSETEGAEIMIDVQDARVLMQWPRRDRERDRDREPLGNLSDSSWDDSPRSRAGASGLLHGSPLRRATRIASPVSPTPANVPIGSLHDLMPDTNDQSATVQIYEDVSADEQELPKLSGGADPLGTSQITEVTNSFSSDLSDPQSDDENDPDEENDPIVHSFGPFGANLSNRLASITATSPRVPQVSRLSSGESTTVTAGAATAEPTRSSKPSLLHASPKAPATAESATTALLNLVDRATISNHVANQLAFSRLASNPLSGIMNNLPAEEKNGLTKDTLRLIIESTACIGVITRQGKDAAGKPLESEYYYVPEMDTDEHRRLAVTDGLRKPSLRNCRKQHKQYYWKRPRTP
ncbi:hypothetical protein QBC33DRAFT_577765 [Phialemonium atrogriseum]|uniref:FHA domain-containing protein n=1 Tax=Phialemonium atrogriseum TaxID=1093897 RepID=A0AAJ0C1C6_9PEZI|nr:uncharacterized protein QBC33DRAFT_577765 [Phialemonium atrogriseum]KAK1768106.1 hypothetical protein QBC33DRAFT_577765 [Phialemonium atrogriseum]